MKKSSFVSLVLGTVSGIMFALGMCMALLPEWNAFKPGLIFGCVGLVLGLITVIVWRRMENKAPVRISGKTLLTVLIGVVGALLSRRKDQELGRGAFVDDQRGEHHAAGERSAKLEFAQLEEKILNSDIREELLEKIHKKQKEVGFFERRLMKSFPEMVNKSYPERLEELKKSLKKRKQEFMELRKNKC